MAYLLLIFFVFFTLFQNGFCQNPQIIGMKVSTNGYVKTGSPRTDNSGLTVYTDIYSRSHQDCMLVLRIEQASPRKSVDQVMVNCAWTGWTVMNSMVSYGSIVHIQTRNNRAAWAVFDMGDKCFQRTYADKGAQQLARTELLLNRQECNRVVLTHKPINRPSSSYAVESQVAEGGGGGTETTTGGTGGSPAAGVTHRVIAMNGDTRGYARGGDSNENHGIIKIRFEDYRQGGNCFMLVKITVHDVAADNFKMTCGNINCWGANDRYQYGSAFIFGKESDNGFLGLYNLGNGKCVRRKYEFYSGFTPTVSKSNEGVIQDGECKDLAEGKDLVSSTVSSGAANVASTSSNNEPQVTEYPFGLGSAEEQAAKDYELISKQKVAVLNGNVQGYQSRGPPNVVQGRAFSFTVQTYVKERTNECVKLVAVRKNAVEVLDQVKISCEYEEPTKIRGHNVRFDAVIFEDFNSKVTYVVDGGECISREYKWLQNQLMKLDVPLQENACDKLTRRSKEDRISGYLPGAKPISAEDIAVMEEQLVAVLEGSVKGYDSSRTKSSYSTNNFQLEVLQFVKDGHCVKVVYISRSDHDQLFDEVKVSCRISEPADARNPRYEFNYGNVIYIEDRSSIVFVVKDGVCLKRNYHVAMDDLEKTDRIISEGECDTLTGWSVQQRKSAAKLNRLPDSVSANGDGGGVGQQSDQAFESTNNDDSALQDFGKLKVLAMNGNAKGFKAKGAKIVQNEGVVSVVSQEFYSPETEECVQKVAIKVDKALAQQLKLTCGQLKVRVVDGHRQYGSAFTFRPEPGIFGFKGLYNVRDEFCVRMIYTVVLGEPTQISKSKFVKTKNLECKSLMEGKDLIASDGISSSQDVVISHTVKQSASGSGVELLDRFALARSQTASTPASTSAKINTDQQKAGEVKGPNRVVSASLQTNSGPAPTSVKSNSEKQKVLAMDGDTSGYTAGGPKDNNNDDTLQMEAQDFYKADGECVKLVTLRVYGVLTQQFKVTCAPFSGRDVNGHYQYGTAFTFRPEMGPDDVCRLFLDAFIGVYNLNYEKCIRINYKVKKGTPVIITRMQELHPIVQECKDLMEGKDVIAGAQPALCHPPASNPASSPAVSGGESTTPSQTNSESTSVDRKTDKLKVLAMDGDTTGYTEGGSRDNKNDDTLQMEAQDFYKADGECVKLVTLRVYGVLTQRFKVTCAPFSGRDVNGHYQYGTAFTFRPESGTDDYKGVYNLNDEKCIRITYKVKKRTPVQIIRMQELHPRVQECKDLIEGKDVISGSKPASGLFSFVPKLFGGWF